MTGRILDQPVSLRLLLILLTPAMTVVGVIAGLLWSEIGTDRSFAVDQRVRIWDELASTQEKIVRVDLDQARLEGQLSQLLREMDRLIKSIDQLREIPR